MCDRQHANTFELRQHIKHGAIERATYCKLATILKCNFSLHLFFMEMRYTLSSAYCRFSVSVCGGGGGGVLLCKFSRCILSHKRNKRVEQKERNNNNKPIEVFFSPFSHEHNKESLHFFTVVSTALLFAR